ncbi:hypothetical protein A7982_13813 [Minicystis rosea]|nr:hypothetical protein A7982_13813 [Minicystis rosea]
MAKIRNNVVLHGVSGMIGKQLVVRLGKDGRGVLAVPPTVAEGRESSAKQKEHQERFRQAILYAKGAQVKPEYQKVADARGVSAFNVATADFFHPPEIREIDLDAYHGGVGDKITIVAVDDVKVAEVGILLTDDDDTVIEKGKAVLSAEDPHRWIYTATHAAPSASVKVVVDVADLAGQVTEETAHT